MMMIGAILGHLFAKTNGFAIIAILYKITINVLKSKGGKLILSRMSAWQQGGSSFGVLIVAICTIRDTSETIIQAVVTYKTVCNYKGDTI